MWRINQVENPPKIAGILQKSANFLNIRFAFFLVFLFEFFEKMTEKMGRSHGNELKIGKNGSWSENYRNYRSVYVESVSGTENRSVGEYWKGLGEVEIVAGLDSH